MDSWFKDEEDPRSRVALAAAEMVAPNDSCFPSMSFKQRLIGFGVTVCLGILLSILGTIMLFLQKMTWFAVLYSLGNICTLLSTGFLIGPMRQLQQMVDPSRLIATIVFFVTLAATLAVAFTTEKAFLCLILVIIQFLAFCWYSISYIPFARELVIKLCGNVFS